MAEIIYKQEPPSFRPSKIDALKAAAAGPYGPMIAMVMALLAAFQAYQTNQSSQSTARTSYETLRVAVEKNAAEIAICRQEIINSQGWTEDLAARIERKQVTVDKAVAKVRPKTIVPPFTEEIPKPPEAAKLPEPTVLPKFEALPD